MSHMNQAVKKKWLDLLEKTQKAHNKLRDPDTGAMCVMGTLCELYRREVEGGEDINVGWDGKIFVYRGTWFPNHAPGGVLKWAGLTPLDQNILIELNDSREGFPIGVIKDL